MLKGETPEFKAYYVPADIPVSSFCENFLGTIKLGSLGSDDFLNLVGLPFPPPFTSDDVARSSLSSSKNIKLN